MIKKSKKKAVDLPRMPISGALNILRKEAKRRKVTLENTICNTCALRTGHWPEGNASLIEHQGIPLVHCQPSDTPGWVVPPIRACLHRIADASIAA